MRGHRVGQHTAFNDRVSGERQENRPAGGRVLFVVDVHVSVFYPVRKKLQTLLQKKIRATHRCPTPLPFRHEKKYREANELTSRKKDKPPQRPTSADSAA